MTQRGDSHDSPGARDDRETLLEIARLIAEADPDSKRNAPAEGEDQGEAAALSESDAGAEPPATPLAADGIGLTNDEDAADRLFEALPSGLALCSGREIVRANASFALAFGYPSAQALIAAGGLAAVFPGHVDALAASPGPEGGRREKRVTVAAVTRSGRRTKIPLAVHDIAGDTEGAVRLLVLHPGTRPSPPEPEFPAPGSGSREDAPDPPEEKRATGAAPDTPAAAVSPPPAAEPLPATGPFPEPEGGTAPGAGKEIDLLATSEAAAGAGNDDADAPDKSRRDEAVETTRKADAAPWANSTAPDFLAKVSHEVRTPLNSIIGFAELMKEERLGSIGNDRYRSYIRDILESGRYALALINDLLDISRIEAGAFELNFASVDLNEVIAECAQAMQPQAHKRRVFLRLAQAEALPPVLADRRSIKQILLNLLSNAIKFTGPGGQVIVNSRHEAPGAVRVCVCDNGVGMSQNEIAQAMEPFRQLDTSPRKQAGSGLGLPLTRALAEANRARFDLESTPESGTRVSLTFPAERTVAR